MKKTIYYLLLLLLPCTAAMAQSDSTTTDLLMTVANLQNDSIAATGVFMRNEGSLYLVATAHIAETMDRNAFVVIQGVEQMWQFKITDFANPVQWIYHPTVDLAVLRLNPKPAFFNKYLGNRCLPLVFTDSERQAMPADSLLTILGFKRAVRGGSFSPPLAYTTIPTAEKVTPADPEVAAAQHLVMLENPSATGYTGGPVFILGETDQAGQLHAGDRLRMVGFVQGKIKDNAARTFVAMIPAFYLRDLIK